MFQVKQDWFHKKLGKESSLRYLIATKFCFFLTPANRAAEKARGIWMVFLVRWCRNLLPRTMNELHGLQVNKPNRS